MKNNKTFEVPAGRIHFQFRAYSDAEILAFFELQRKRIKQLAGYPQMPGLAGKYAMALWSMDK
ncbi:MAG: hypothetical protein ACK5DE_09190 [Bacteroidota bacterium]|jgi:hypothetical protein